MNFPPSVRVAPDSGSHPLHRIVGFLVDDRLMGVLDDVPLVLVNVVAFLVLEVFPCFEIAVCKDTVTYLCEVNEEELIYRENSTGGIHVDNFKAILDKYKKDKPED